MKAQLCTALGAPDVLRYTDIDDPVPGPDEILVEVHAAGINFPDGLIVSGNYQTKPALPFVPGSEAAGVVRAGGANLIGIDIGSRVLVFCGMGGYAEQVAVPATMVFPIPDSMSYVDAAGFVVTYGTSCHGLVDKAGLAPGSTLLVLGASGGVGLTAVEIGKALGARVIAAASSPGKLEVCRDHGADELIDYTADDLKSRLAALAPGGVDVVYDPVGGEHAQTAIRALAWGGQYLTVGYASGDIPKVGMNRLLVSSGALHGVLWGAWAKRNPDRNAENMRQLFDWYDQGRLRPHVGATYPLSEAAAALDAVMGRRARGKVVLTIR